MSKLAYTLEEAAAEVGVSKRAIEIDIADNRLVPHYWRTKPLIGHDELLRWFEALPTEKAGAA